MTAKIEEIIQRAYTLAVQVMNNEIDHVLAEELSGECGELLAFIDDNNGAFKWITDEETTNGNGCYR